VVPRFARFRNRPLDEAGARQQRGGCDALWGSWQTSKRWWPRGALSFGLEDVCCDDDDALPRASPIVDDARSRPIPIVSAEKPLAIVERSPCATERSRRHAGTGGARGAGSAQRSNVGRWHAGQTRTSMPDRLSINGRQSSVGGDS